MSVVQGAAQRLAGLPGEGLHVLLAAGGLDEAGRGRDGQPAQRVDLARGALVHGDQPGVRARPGGQLRGQAGNPGVEQPVHARRCDLGRVRERGGQLVAVRAQVDPVESGGAREPPAQERGRVGHPGERAADRGFERVPGPHHLGEDRADHPERHRRLQGPRLGVVADGRAQPGEHAGHDRVAPRARRRVGVAGRPVPLPRAEAELGEAAGAQRFGRGHGLGARRPEHPADPDQGPERMGQGRDLAGAAHAGPRDRRDEALAKDVGQPPAQPGGYAGVAGQERAQPDRDERPRVGRVQPGRAAGRAGQHQVALVGKLLGLAETDPGQGAHAGVHAVHRIAAAQDLAGRGAAPVNLPEQRRRDLDPFPGGDAEDQPGIQVIGRGDQARHGQR